MIILDSLQGYKIKSWPCHLWPTVDSYPTHKVTNTLWIWPLVNLVTRGTWCCYWCCGCGIVFWVTVKEALLIYDSWCFLSGVVVGTRHPVSSWSTMSWVLPHRGILMHRAIVCDRLRVMDWGIVLVRVAGICSWVLVHWGCEDRGGRWCLLQPFWSSFSDTCLELRLYLEWQFTGINSRLTILVSI